MNKDIEKRKEQIVVLIEYSFEQVLLTFIDSYECLDRTRDIDSLIDNICISNDFKGFCETYCDGFCEEEEYLSFIFNHGNIEYLIRDWSFNEDKFNKDFIIPFHREETIKRLLE
jgi:hypothetical protein